MTSLERKLALIVWHQGEYDKTERPFHHQTMDSLLKDVEVQSAIARVNIPEDPQLTRDEPGVYTVRAMVLLKPKIETNFSWAESMRWIQEHFEQNEGAVHFASIERVA